MLLKFEVDLVFNKWDFCIVKLFKAFQKMQEVERGNEVGVAQSMHLRVKSNVYVVYSL